MTLKQKVFWLTIGLILSACMMAIGGPERNQPLKIDQSIERDHYESDMPLKAASLWILAVSNFEFSINEAKTMASDQFHGKVLKYGIPGKEPEYDCHNESLRLGLLTSENRKAVIHDRIKSLRPVMKKKDLVSENEDNELEKAIRPGGFFYALFFQPGFNFFLKLDTHNSLSV